MVHRFIISIILLLVGLIGCSQGNFLYNQHYVITAAVNVPTVTTQLVTNITNNSVTVNATVVSNGGGTIQARGVALAYTPEELEDNWNIPPSYYDDYTTLGSFSGNIFSLGANNSFYYRAWALNEAGFGWGEMYQFTTLPAANIPAVTMDSINYRIAINRVLLYGNVTNDGGSTVTQRGFVLNTTGNPTIGNGVQYSGGSGNGAYSIEATNLGCGIDYYIKAYAINSAGTAYSSQLSFKIDAVNFPSLPTYYRFNNRCVDMDTRGSLSDAIAALDNYNMAKIEGCVTQIRGYSARALSTDNGTQVYSFSGCERTPYRNGYYVLVYAIENFTTAKIIAIDSNGILVSSYDYIYNP